MNVRMPRPLARLFDRLSRDDIADAAGAALIFGALIALIWMLAALGLTEAGYDLVGPAR